MSLTASGVAKRHHLEKCRAQASNAAALVRELQARIFVVPRPRPRVVYWERYCPILDPQVEALDDTAERAALHRLLECANRKYLVRLQGNLF